MTAVDEFTGNWTYRSFHNKPGWKEKADDILVGAGELTLEQQGAGGLSTGLEVGGISAGLDLGGSKISGKLSFPYAPNICLTVSGTAKHGKPPIIRFRATGIDGTPTAGWIYDYIGYLAPSWPKGARQQPTIVGTVIRTVQHGESPAGYTMSFIAVSQDHPATGS